MGKTPDALLLKPKRSVPDWGKRGVVGVRVVVVGGGGKWEGVYLR